MKLSELTIDSIKEFISGDNGLTPELSGPKILKLFNQVGFKDVYKWGDGGMPNSVSRNTYVFDRLMEINGTKEMKNLLEIVFDPRHFAKDTKKDIIIAVEKINPLLQQDGYRLETVDGKYKIIGADLPDNIEVEVHFEEIQKQIVEQIRLAKFTIWVAVAWFTDKDLMRELYNQKQKGIYLCDNNLVLAVSKEGAKIWEYALGDNSNGSLATEGDVIFANCDNGILTALNKNDGQTVVWTKTVGRAIDASPTVANGKVYIQGDTKYYCLDASNGNEVWSISQEPSYTSSSPIVDNDGVYVNALERGINAYNTANGELIWSKSNTYAGKSYGAVVYNDMIIDSGSSGIGLRKKSDGSLIWTYGEYDKWNPKNQIESNCSAVVYNTETKQAYYSSDNGNTLY